MGGDDGYHVDRSKTMLDAALELLQSRCTSGAHIAPAGEWRCCSVDEVPPYPSAKSSESRAWESNRTRKSSEETDCPFAETRCWC